MTHTRWSSHLLRDVLPWWEGQGADDEGGGVRTGFDNRGGLVSTDRFTWSQGRWAWICGELADEAATGRLPLDESLWRRRSLATCDRLLREAVRNDGRTHFRVTESGDPVADDEGETATSVFADLFCVLGLAAGLRQLPDGDPRHELWQDTAERILTTAAKSIVDGTATAEPYPVPDGFNDLAGPMTLLHVAAEVIRSPLEDSSFARRVRDDAGGRLMERHLAHGKWREFAPTRAGLEETMLARHVTPGHLLELLWMTAHAEDQDPSFRLLDPQDRAGLALRAMAVGWDDEHGGILRYTDVDGGPPRGAAVQGSRYESLVRATWGTKLWWVHVEALYALKLFSADSRAIAEWADRVGRWTMDVFPSPPDEWIQIRDRSGSPLDEVVALPVKDPFHVIRALIFLHRLESTD